MIISKCDALIILNVREKSEFRVMKKLFVSLIKKVKRKVFSIYKLIKISTKKHNISQINYCKLLCFTGTCSINQKEKR